MSAACQKRPIAIVTACMTREGTPTFTFHEVTVTPEEIENGIHYYLAEAELLEAGYEEPFVHFDALEGPAFLHPAVRQYLGLPPTVPEPATYAPSEEA
jgi:hypothetical protein